MTNLICEVAEMTALYYAAIAVILAIVVSETTPIVKAKTAVVSEAYKRGWNDGYERLPYSNPYEKLSTSSADWNSYFDGYYNAPKNDGVIDA